MLNAAKHLGPRSAARNTQYLAPGPYFTTDISQCPFLSRISQVFFVTIEASLLESSLPTAVRKRFCGGTVLLPTAAKPCHHKNRQAAVGGKKDF